MATIKLKRGLKTNIPASAASGEPVWITDTQELFIGDGPGNALVKVTGGSGGTSDHRDLTNRDATDSHPATAISYDPTTSGLSAIEVNAAIDEVLGIAYNVDGGVWG